MANNISACIAEDGKVIRFDIFQNPSSDEGKYISVVVDIEISKAKELLFSLKSLLGES